MRKIVFLKIVFLLIALLLAGCTRPERTDFRGSYTSEKTYSYDHLYYALQTVEDKMVVVTVYITDDDTPIASFTPARALDFWGICWEKDTYNIWTQSADIGTFCFEFLDGNWVPNTDMECPDYIISRYNAQYRDNFEMQKNMYISPTD